MKTLLKSALLFLIFTVVVTVAQCICYFNSKHKTTPTIEMTSLIYNEVSDCTEVDVNLSIKNNAYHSGHVISSFKYKLAFRNENDEVIHERIIDGNGSITDKKYEQSLSFAIGNELGSIPGKVSSVVLTVHEATYVNEVQHFEQTEGKEFNDTILYRMVMFIGLYVLIVIAHTITEWLEKGLPVLLCILIGVLTYGLYVTVFIPIYDISFKMVLLNLLPPL